MEQTTLTISEIDYLLKKEETSSKVLRIFFLFWKAFGIIGILACLSSLGTEVLNAPTMYEKVIMAISMVMGLLMISGFFLGIPTLINNASKKRINKIKNREVKAYLSNVVDKRRFRRDKKNYYHLYFQNGNQTISVKTTSRAFDSLDIGDEALIIDFGQGVSNLEAYNRNIMNF